MITRSKYGSLLGVAGLVFAAGAHGQPDATRLTAPQHVPLPLQMHAMAAKRGAPPTPVQFVPGSQKKDAAQELRRASGVTPTGVATGRYFVTLTSPSLVHQLAEARAARGDTRPLSLQSADATRYEAQLVVEQQAALASFEGVLGRSVVPKRSFTKALNGFSIDASPEEAARLAAHDGVRSVQPVLAHKVSTDAGPALIGAPAIWDGSATGTATLGEGTVVGIIDTGINSDHPSFAQNSGGYVHVNPFGDGVFRGWCADPANAGFCNNKLIGAYDMVYDLIEGSPDYTDEPSPEDSHGHGSHVAGTAAGNAIQATYNGFAGINLSGVAPQANIIAYDTCYTEVQTGQGFCPDDATTAAVEQAIDDGVVDVINFSIGGGYDPYGDMVSQAFLAATEMGIYVAAAAGNEGPEAASSGHQQPWVATTGASTHDRTFAGTLSVTGPGVPPEPLTGIRYVPSATVAVSVALSLPLRDVASIAPNDPAGCSAYPASALDGQIALLSRGGCNFSVKMAHAQAAGAAAVVLYNNVPGPAFPIFSVGDPPPTIPLVMIEQSDGMALATFAASHPEATLELGALMPLATTADVMAAFSSRGPNWALDVLKPDLAAPGVDILSAVADGGGLGTPGTELDLYSGTSMASPHHAGAAALLRALHPAWSPMQISRR